MMAQSPDVHEVRQRDAAPSYTRNPSVQLAGQPATVTGPGTVATAPVGRGRPTKYAWDETRQLLEDNPGLWVLVFEKFSSGMYSYVRNGGPVALRSLGGNLQMSLRDQHVDGKTKYGHLWLRWEPEGWTPADQARVEAALAAREGGG